MSDPHFNIFHAYRGSNRSEAAAYRQLEDNLTRALGITLRAIHGTSMQAALLERLGFDSSESEDDYRVHLQLARPPTTPPAKRFLLVIHGGPKLQMNERENTATTSRVDAVVVSRRTMVAIESKIDNVVERSQLDRHRAAFEVPATNVFDLTWSELARAIRSISLTPAAPHVARYVLSQFEEYLTMNGFGGLTHEHFAYFALPPEERDMLVKDGIRRSLEEIGGYLVKGIPTEWNRRVLNIASNASHGADFGVVVIEPGSRASHPHLTISIDSSGLHIHPNIELEPPYQRFKKTLRGRPAGLTGLLRQLGRNPIRSDSDRPWRFRVVRRTPLGPPRQYHYYPLIDVATTVFQTWDNSELVGFIEKMTTKPDGEAAPQILIVKTHPSTHLLAADDFESTLLDDIREIEPFFDWIGEPIRATK